MSSKVISKTNLWSIVFNTNITMQEIENMSNEQLHELVAAFEMYVENLNKK
ncbi:hypothetical protein [Clostridium niameyense]|uniref:hypothetical protein n=1 Tax=Clostridium niameyense TaxID=1622073 RepID=UPI0013D5A1D7|nr:hypothetical protein [Clostridium niameyense]